MVIKEIVFIEMYYKFIIFLTYTAYIVLLMSFYLIVILIFVNNKGYIYLRNLSKVVTMILSKNRFFFLDRHPGLNLTQDI